MENLTFKQIREAIEKSKNIGIVTPEDPSLDKMAAALALYLSISQGDKSVRIATPKNPLVEVSSLVGIDKVKTDLASSEGDLIVSFPYKEGEIEKVSYTLDDDLLNIVVKAGENGLNFEEKDVRFTRGQKAPELLFIIGAARVSELGKLFDPQALKETTVINIDNQPDNQGYGDLIMVSSKFSSVSEAIANLIVSLGLKMDIDIAQNLMMGISDGTENFQNPKTTPLAFEMAGILMRQGAVRSGKKQEPRSRDLESLIQRQPQVEEPQQEEPQTRQEPDVMQAPQKQEEEKQQVEEQGDNPPDDWLAPKIYKGSTDFE